MIRIKKIDIKNYKSCIRTTTDLNSHLSTLIGVNGVGKSNILNSIQLFKKANKNKLFEQSKKEKWIIHTELNLSIIMDEQDYDLKGDFFYEVNENNTELMHTTEIKIKASRSKKWIEVDPDMYEFADYFIRTNKKINIDDVFWKNKSDKKNNKLSFKIISYLLGISYYWATQFSDPSKCPTAIELDDSRLRHGRKGKNHEQFIFDLFQTYESDKKAFAKYINIVNKSAIGLVDDITFFNYKVPNSSYVVKTGGKVEKIEKTKTIIVPSIALDGLSLSFNQLSEWTLKTLALIFYILNDKSNLLLIEEPEVCVHHWLLSSIIELIKIESREKQIIISSHSDYLLDKLKPENIILVEKNREWTTATALSKYLSKQVFSWLKDYLDNSGNLWEYWKEWWFDK